MSNNSAMNKPRSKKKASLIIAFLMIALILSWWFYVNMDGPINRAVYGRIQLGMSEKEVEDIVQIEEGWKNFEQHNIREKIAKEGDLDLQGKDVHSKQSDKNQTLYYAGSKYAL